MKECYRLLDRDLDAAADCSAAMYISLDYQQRQKSRHRARTDCGQELGWFLERGRVLCDGDVLLCNDGSQVQVVAAEETVSEVHYVDAHLLMRAAYHLGNRHVPLQIGEGWLRYQHDHVLDDMLAGLGLTVDCVKRPFHPENGAYHGSGQHHHSNHSHSHDHGHHHHHG